MNSRIEAAKSTLTRSGERWAQEVQSRPRTLLGLAIVAGIVAAVVVTEQNRRWRRRAPVALRIWNGLKGAVTGAAAARMLNYAGGVVAGFRKNRPGLGSLRHMKTRTGAA